jgi:hypothetical protein
MLAPFQGVKLATTPSGRRTPIEWVLGRFEASTSLIGTGVPRDCSGRGCNRFCHGLLLVCWQR